MVGHLCRRKKHTLAIFMGTGIIIIIILALSSPRFNVNYDSYAQLFFPSLLHLSSLYSLHYLFVFL